VGAEGGRWSRGRELDLGEGAGTKGGRSRMLPRSAGWAGGRRRGWAAGHAGGQVAGKGARAAADDGPQRLAKRARNTGLSGSPDGPGSSGLNHSLALSWPPFLAPILDPGFGAGDQTLLSGRGAEDGAGPSPGPIGHRGGAAFAGWDHPGQGRQGVQPPASASSTSISSSTSAAWS
jgi:hypothetical protein